MRNPCVYRYVAVLMLSAMTQAQGADWYVDAASAGAEIGTQENPFRTVQAAIDAAASTDVIRVAAGSYVQNLRIEAKAIGLEGGYSRGFVRDLAANTTVLIGAGGNAVISIISSDATIDGFRITGGTGSTDELPFAVHGGGIYSRDGSPVIINNIIENNDLRNGGPEPGINRGGGIYVENAPTTTIRNNIIRTNYAGRGAGAFVSGQAATIEGNTIQGNVGIGDHGGGLFISVTNSRIRQNIIRGNEIGRSLGYGWGGGVIVVSTGNTAELAFNAVFENFAAAYGAGEFIDEGATANIHHELIYRNVSRTGCEAVSAIAVDGGDGVGSTATINHCTIVNNVCENSARGNGLQVEGLSNVTVTNSIFFGNGGDDFAVDGTSTLSVAYSDSQEPVGGTGNISADPLFVNAAADDYHLAAGSPCIDAADPAAPFNEETAPNGGRADMGRFGNAAASGAAGSTQTGNTGNTGNTGGTGDNSGGGGLSAGSAACPGTAALMLSMSLLGARVIQRRRTASGQD